MKKIIILVVLSFFLAIPVLATERVDDYDVKINLNEDGSLDIEEHILYNFDSNKRHGIYRTIPYKYEKNGYNFNLRISDIKVYDKDGGSYHFKISNDAKNKKIKIGDADKLVSGIKEYIIRYKVKRAIGYFDDYDELYWNVVGDKWGVPIMQSKLTVFFEKHLEAKDVKMKCFSGTLKSQSSCNSSRYDYDGGLVKSVVFIDDKLNPGNFFTIVLDLPKDFIKKQSAFINFISFLEDNYIIFLPFLVFFFFLSLWIKKGKDPRGKKTIIAQFEAPDNLSPAEVGTIIDEKVNQKDISSEIINLAIKGYLKLIKIKEKNIIFKKEDYLLYKIKDEDSLDKEHEKYLMKSLFKKSNLIENKDFKKLQEAGLIDSEILENNLIRLSDLNDNFYKDLEEIKTKVYDSLVEGKYFPKNPNKVRRKYLFIVFIFLFSNLFFWTYFGFLGFISTLSSAFIVFIFSFLMPKKTKKGVLAREYILGLKKYMEVAEKDRIDFHNAPEKNPKIFEKLLPYAMVLKVEKKWSKQFKDIYNQTPDWYNGGGYESFSSGQLVKDLDGFSAKANSNLSSAPSSSGSSGGGFSGGGFGGGGGGSW